MKVLQKLNKILNNKEDIKSLDWDELHNLREKYPYSQLISQVMAKKHYLETGYLLSSHFTQSSHLQNQLAASYNNLLFWEESIKKKVTAKKKKSRKKKKTRSIEKEKMVANQFAKIEGNESGFTKWLLTLDNKINPLKEQEQKHKEKASIALKEEIISESLAKIYEKQGLIDEAVEMYAKLSLKNPEKSAYFAGLIENLKKR